MSFNDLNFDLFGGSRDDTDSAGNNVSEDVSYNDFFDGDETPQDTNEESPVEGSEEETEENIDSEEGSSDVEQEVPEEEQFDVEGEIESLEEESFEPNTDNGISDEEFQGLLASLENEMLKDDPEEDVMQNILDELRISNAEKDSELAFYKKQVERFQQRDLERADSDIEFGMAKPILEKVNSNPKLKQLIHFANTEDEVSKNRFADVLADLYEQTTGVNIATLIEKDQQAGMSSAFAKSSSNSMSFNQNRQDDEDDSEYMREDRNMSFFD